MSVSTRKQKPTRESVTTIADDGSRNFLRPADVSGRYTSWRRISAFILILIYIALPWIEVNGFPAVFLDVVHRRFHLFGITFAAQDIWLFFFFITGLGFTLFFTTALFGRLWCGWACPHTVFLEHVYRRIERLCEGPAKQQKALDNIPWSDPAKLFRRGSKHLIFIFISWLIAHVFLAYFVSIPQLYEWILDKPTEHWEAFLFMVIATGVLYFNFSWFREQLCLIICPYGRLQSALTDDDTLVVGYDEIRGEPRGKPGTEGVGDCINCNRCVAVCPTGIDIRQGYQMECVGCMSCLDACDEVMDKLHRPRGLINYAAANTRARQQHKILRPRVFVYLILLFFGLGAMGYSFSTYDTATMSVVRMAGAPFYVRSDNIQNQFNIRLINKRSHPQTYFLNVRANQPSLKAHGTGQPITVDPMDEVVRPLVLTVPIGSWRGRFDFEVVVSQEGSEETSSRAASFVGPNPSP